MSELSKDELALYDRQIRLWGLEAQKKLREGSILLICTDMNIIVQEICKNLALFGIYSLKLSIKTEEYEEPLIYSCLESELKEIHPRLVFERTNQEVAQYDQFDFVITCGHPNQLDFLRINELARKTKTCNLLCFEAEGKFFLLNDFGEFTVNYSNGPKTIKFPSFSSISNFPCDILKENDAKSKFYKVINAESLKKITTKDSSDVAGSAIIGALVSQEVMKSFSKIDAPINNLFIFDSLNLKNNVATVGIIS